MEGLVDLVLAVASPLVQASVLDTFQDIGLGIGKAFVLALACHIVALAFVVAFEAAGLPPGIDNLVELFVVVSSFAP